MEYRTSLQIIESKAHSYNGMLQKPVSSEQLARMCHASRSLLSFEIPQGYIDFLQLHNGIDWNGFSIYASEIILINGYMDRYINGFVEANLQYKENDKKLQLISFGETGDSRYVYDLQQSSFCLIDRVSSDSIENYLNFEQMCASLLSRSIA